MLGVLVRIVPLASRVGSESGLLLSAVKILHTSASWLCGVRCAVVNSRVLLHAVTTVRHSFLEQGQTAASLLNVPLRVMGASVRRQMTRIGRLSTLPELTKILLRLQVLLTEADLSVLATVCRSSAITTQHASIVRDRLHTVRYGTVYRVGLRRLLSKVLLVPWGHATAAIAPRRKHLRILAVLDGTITLHTARLLLVLIVVILSAAIINNHAFSMILNPKVTI